MSEGQVLAGRYELLGLLGTGGMGAVYRARDRELDEVVALKMLRRELVDMPGMLGRFRQEAKLARRVTHGNVARTFDIGEHEGAKFLTMEYVDGESLAAVLERERCLPLDRVIEIVEPLCAGLSAAHAAGVVHRDLKPANVLVAKDGRIVVTDFGIARAFSGDAQKTQGVPVGTPIYMAPEQVEASPTIDARADIYALGAMLYELITGEVPWDGPSAIAIAARRLTSPPPDPRSRRPDLPDAIATVVLRCMARRPEDRFASAIEVATALAAVTVPAAFSALSSNAARSALARPTAPAPGTGLLAEAHKTVAVLPLRNAGPAEDEYLADGITEDLIDTLSMNPALRVRSRGAVVRWKGADPDPRLVGRELDVQVVVDGSVRRQGEQLRVAVKLVSVADGFQLWAKRFERPAAEVLAVGDEAAEAIAHALMVSWNAHKRAAPTSPIALDLLLRARHALNKRWKDATMSAIDLFERALQEAPSDPTILSHYAVALARAHALGGAGGTNAERARAVAERAIAEGPELGASHHALACIELYTGDAMLAVREVRTALALAPTLPEAHELYGRILVELGETARGIRHLEMALQIDPKLEPVSFELARVKCLEGMICADAFPPEPSDPELLNSYWIARARVVLWSRDVAAARECEAAMERRPFGMRAAMQSLLRILTRGTIDEVAAQSLEMQTDNAPTTRRRAFFCQVSAEVHAAGGDREKALAAIEKGASLELIDLSWIDRCPLFDDLRTEPRFAVVRAKVAARVARVLAAAV